MVGVAKSQYISYSALSLGPRIFHHAAWQ